MAWTRLPYCSPYRLIWAALGTPRTAAQKIHHAYARFVWWSPGWSHYPLIAALCLLWPAVFLAMLGRYTFRIGPAVARATGKPVPRQILEQLWLSVRHSIAPDNYYVFELFRPERLRNAADYILRHELKGGINNLVHYHCVRTLRRSTNEVLKNKLSFYRSCASAGVDSPAVLLVMDPDGTLTPEATHAAELPRADLFIKPAQGKGGRGCERWKRIGGIYLGPGDRFLDVSALLQHIRALAAARRGRYLIQECLSNHRALRDLGDGLTSLRITTCRNENGTAEITNAVLKMSLGAGASVDNFHQGGAGCKVEIATGEVGPAWDSWIHRPCIRHDVHPATGARIAGRILPCWPETLAAVARCANLFPDRYMIGFDVAITERGPVIIEGNVQQSSEMVQRTHELPAGMQRLGELLAWNATQALASRPSAVLAWYEPRKVWSARLRGRLAKTNASVADRA